VTWSGARTSIPSSSWKRAISCWLVSSSWHLHLHLHRVGRPCPSMYKWEPGATASECVCQVLFYY